MPTITLTPSQLKGAGILNSFEIPAVGGTQTINKTAEITSWGHVPASGYSDWASAISASSASTEYVDPAMVLGGSVSGRGGTRFLVGRHYHQFKITGDGDINGTVTAISVKLVEVQLGALPATTAQFGGGVNIYAAGSGSVELGQSGTEFSLYDVSGSKTPYSTSQTINSSGNYTFQLNQAAVDDYNTAYSNGTKLLNFALILDNDFNGVAPPLSAGNVYSYTTFGDVIYTLTYIPN